uniref:PNMA family member 1 n=1 Tax=Pygocentrus nattereri TaxID=42514 RepID=A0AAR2JPL1_PYGNA
RALILLRNWCRGEGLDIKHVFMLIGVPEDTDVAYIEETMQSIKALGRVRVRGKMFDPQQNSLVVFCECREVVDITRVPSEVIPSDGRATWKLIISDEPSSSTEDFTEKLSRLLREEGKTWSDIPALHALSSSYVSSPESIIQAVGDLLEKASKPSCESSAYKRLRTFSGTSPTPAGEETLENWLEQAKLMAEECGCPDREKRRRIVESLKSPDLGIFQAVKAANPEASPMEYVEAIESSFGSMESGEDLYFGSKTVQRGGLPATSVDKVRVEQLLRGAVDSDLMLLQLRLRERKNNPPSFLKLLNEIKDEEELEVARQRMNPPSRRSYVEEAVDRARWRQMIRCGDP